MCVYECVCVGLSWISLSIWIFLKHSVYGGLGLIVAGGSLTSASLFTLSGGLLLLLSGCH